MGQRTFETKSFYLILAEKLFTLPAANEMLPLSALFAGKSREVGKYPGILIGPQRWNTGTLGRFPGTDLDQPPQRATTYVSRTAAVARAAMRTRFLRSQIRFIRCQSAAPSATRLASGTRKKIDATAIRTMIASAVSRIERPGVCQQSQVWIPRSRVETEYQTGITFPSTRAK